MSTPIHILLVYGSVRESRQGIGLVRYLEDRLKARDCTVAIADPMDIDLPLLNRMYKEYPKGEAPEPMERMAAMIRACDGVVVVSGEYNHGIPPALKNLIDHFLEEWYFRPAGIACYSAGRYGGVRAAMQLRMTLAEIGMPTISSLLPVPTVSQVVSADGTLQQDWLAGSAERFLDELVWWADAARTKKATAGPPF